MPMLGKEPLVAGAGFPFGQQIVWRPDSALMAQSNLAALMARHGIVGYDALLRRAAEDIAWFWDAVFEELGIEFTVPYSQVVDLSSGIERPRWCVGGQMNIVRSMLDKWLGPRSSFLA